MANGKLGEIHRRGIAAPAGGINLKGKDLSKLPDWQRQILEKKFRVRPHETDACRPKPVDVSMQVL